MINRKLRGPVAAVVATFLINGTSAAATTVVVTPSTLVAAFNAAQGGDTLQLVGTFGAQSLRNRAFAQILTIDASSASFTDKFELDNVKNVRFSGGSFDLSGDAAWTKGILLNGGQNVYIDGVSVAGSGLQWGVSVVGTGNAQITNGTFSGLNAAVLFGSVTGGVASHNTITGAESDGIDIADSHFITASNNSCSSGLPGLGVHPDCIQLWSVSGNPLQSDITVINNRATGPTQGFTSFSGGGGGLRLKFIGNAVNTSFSQGVACYDCIDSVIANNRVSTLPGSTYQTVINVIGGSGNAVYGNSVAAYQPSDDRLGTADGDVAVAPGDGTAAAQLAGCSLRNLRNARWLFMRRRGSQGAGIVQQFHRLRSA